ncbi:MAG: response regulator transcription factor [Balneolaceae bacterium]|nr:response regulator transcription factor [Balneolaceae bacterium]
MSVRYTHIAMYGIALALLAILLDLLNYYYLVRIFSPEFYIVCIALFFAAVGVWVGRKLTSNDFKSSPFSQNKKALAELEITDRELEVLKLIAAGYSNQQIADQLYISIHTVKSHVSSLLDKMNVNRRTQAIRKAQKLQLIP